MGVSFRFWDDCVEPKDLSTMWMDPDVATEWINAGETKGSKIHLSRDPDGQPYLTQTEMKAVTRIVVQRHFGSQIDPDMLCALAELESNRQLLTTRYNKKSKETTIGIMQISQKTAEWLVRDLGYQTYDITGDSKLHKPFVNIYLGAAYLSWLSNFDKKERNEEFMVRAYTGGTKMATHKSTLQYWNQYLCVKENLPTRKAFEVAPLQISHSPPAAPRLEKKGPVRTTWDSRTSAEDMEDMWKHPSVRKEWKKSREKKGKVRLSHDTEKKPYLLRVELKGVADIIISKHFNTIGIKSTVLCALAEIVNMRYVNGIGQRTGLMGIDYPTARWLYKALGYKAYKPQSAEDLTKPFVSMYFGAAYVVWLSKYEGRDRTPQFIVQAYLGGPQNVELREMSPLWLKYEEALSRYENMKKPSGDCCIL